MKIKVAVANTARSRSLPYFKSWSGGFALVLFGCFATTGCNTITVNTSPEGTVVQERFFEKEATDNRTFKETRLKSLEVAMTNRDILEIHLSSISNATFVQYRDWSVAYKQEEEKSSSLVGCAADVALSPFLFLIMAAGSDTSEAIENCTGATTALNDEIRHPDDAPEKTGKVFVREIEEPYNGPVRVTVNAVKNKIFEIAAQGGIARVSLSELQRMSGVEVREVDVTVVTNPQPSFLQGSIAELTQLAIAKSQKQTEYLVRRSHDAQESSACQEQCRQQTRMALHECQRIADAGHYDADFVESCPDRATTERENCQMRCEGEWGYDAQGHDLRAMP